MKRSLEGGWGTAFSAVCLAFMLFQLAAASFLYLPDMQLRAVHVAFGLALAYMGFSFRQAAQPQRSVSLVDIAIIVAAVVTCLAAAYNYRSYHENFGQSSTWDLVMGVMLVVIVVEAGRRTMGWFFPGMIIAVLLYCVAGPWVPGLFGHPGLDLETMVQTIYQGTQGAWGSVTGISAQVLVMFIAFGTLLQVSGGGQVFIDLAIKLAGRYRGGPALVAVVSSGLFGTLSGSPTANAMTVGTFTIPLMRKLGYKPAFAGGVESTASCGGVLMPPVMGAGAFIMAEVLNIPYTQIAAAALIPAFIFYVSVFLSVQLEARKLGLKAIDPRDIPAWRDIVTWRRCAPLFVPVAVLVTLLMRGFTPQTCAFWAWAAGVLLFVFSDLSWSGLRQRCLDVVTSLQRAAVLLIEFIPLMVLAGIFLALLNASGGGIKLAEGVTMLTGGGTLPVLAVGAVLTIILGFPLPSVAAYLIAASVVGPVVMQLGMPALATHLFLFYFSALAPITPPVAPTVFATSLITEASWAETNWWALRLAAIAFIMPFSFVYQPGLLMMGSWEEIVISSATTLAAAILLGAGVIGYLHRRLHIVTRLLMLVAAAMFLSPPAMFTFLVGAGAVAGALAAQKLLDARAAPAGHPSPPG
jgi:TRAP transporter 4TM/12TM fusion protein